MKKNYFEDAEKFVPGENEWELTFSDDFSFFDRSKWKINTCINEKNPEKNGIRNDCYYTDDEDIIFTENGKLYIRTKYKEGRYGKGWYSGFIETSKNIRDIYKTEGYKGFSQTGGYFECRCKVAKAFGIWSAFWLMPDNNIAFSPDDVQYSGEDGLEIDIMESPHWYRQSERLKNQNIHVIHADGYDERLKSMASPSLYVPSMYDEFHTYSFMWDEDKYTFFIDGYKTWETRHVIDGKDFGICKVPEYIILSTEVAGTIKDGKHYEGLVYNSATGQWDRHWCGNPGRNNKKENYDFIVDYVKCYKRKD